TVAAAETGRHAGGDPGDGLGRLPRPGRGPGRLENRRLGHRPPEGPAEGPAVLRRRRLPLAARPLLRLAAVVRPLPTPTTLPAAGEGGRPARRAGVRVVPALEAAGAAAVVVAQGEAVAAPRPRLPGEHQLHGQPGRPRPGRPRRHGPGGEHGRRALVRPRL